MREATSAWSVSGTARAPISPTTLYAPSASSRPPSCELRPREAEHEDRLRPRPLDEVLDEVEEAGIGPLEILEDQNRGLIVGETLEEETPGREEVVPLEGRIGESEQVREPGFDPLAIVCIGNVLGH